MVLAGRRPRGRRGLRLDPFPLCRPRSQELVAARADRDEAFQPTLSRREDSCDHSFGAERTLISPTGMDSFVPPSDRMSLRESGKRSPDYRFRAHIYPIRTGYTQFSVTYTQFRSAIHNSLQLYTIPISYTQFERSYTQFGRIYTQFRVGHARPNRSVCDPPLHPQGVFDPAIPR